MLLELLNIPLSKFESHSDALNVVKYDFIQSSLFLKWKKKNTKWQGEGKGRKLNDFLNIPLWVMSSIEDE